MTEPARPDQTHPKLEELISVLHRLRAPGGCAWDAEQTHESLVRYLVEETFELVEAIEAGSRDEIIEELGDVLYQVIFHADIAAHTPGEDFTIEDVAAHMTAKMISRHPHVFGDAAAKAEMNVTTGDDVVAVWDELKKADKPNRTSVLDGIPRSMPALALADKVLGRAEKAGLRPRAIANEESHRESTDASARNEAELGAALLAIVSAAREKGLDPERALRGALRETQREIREHESAHRA